jgi:hypothetical protein
LPVSSSRRASTKSLAHRRAPSTEERDNKGKPAPLLLRSLLLLLWLVVLTPLKRLDILPPPLLRPASQTGGGVVVDTCTTQ